MIVTRMTPKGQVTIPIEIRELLGLRPRDRVRFDVVDGKVQISAAPSTLERFFGSVPVPASAPDLREEREAFEQAMADEGGLAHRS